MQRKQIERFGEGRREKTIFKTQETGRRSYVRLQISESLIELIVWALPHYKILVHASPWPRGTGSWHPASRHSPPSRVRSWRGKWQTDGEDRQFLNVELWVAGLDCMDCVSLPQRAILTDYIPPKSNDGTGE